MTHVTIVVENGFVTGVYSNSKNVTVDMINLDVTDDSQYEEAQKALYNTRQTMQSIL